MIISTKRLILRPIRREDAEAVFSYRSDRVANMYQSWFPESVEEIHELAERDSKTLGVFFQLVLVDKEIGMIIGDSGVNQIDEHQVELGITINKEYQNKGYATEAIEAITNYYFQLGIHRIFVSIDPRNVASIRIFEKLGFRKEAHHLKSILLNGEWVDDVIYALLNSEWKRK